MDHLFEEALAKAREKYPHPINRYEEFQDYYVLTEGAVM